MGCDLQDKYPEKSTASIPKPRKAMTWSFPAEPPARTNFSKDFLQRSLMSYTGTSRAALLTARSTIFLSANMVADNYKRMGDRNRAFILFIKWMGFKLAVIDVEHSERDSVDPRTHLKSNFSWRAKSSRPNLTNPWLCRLRSAVLLALPLSCTG